MLGPEGRDWSSCSVMTRGQSIQRALANVCPGAEKRKKRERRRVTMKEKGIEKTISISSMKIKSSLALPWTFILIYAISFFHGSRRKASKRDSPFGESRRSNRYSKRWWRSEE